MALEEDAKIALICNVGFASEWHPFGIALLKENLERRTNLAVDNYYLSSEFTWYIEHNHRNLKEINENIGEEGEAYHEIYFSTKVFNQGRPRKLIEKVVSDAVRERDIYRERLSSVGSLKNATQYDGEFVRKTLKYCRLLDWFLRNKVGSIEWSEYKLIGFSCLSPQLLSSVFMATMIKKRHPDAVIVFGGGMFREWNISQYKKLFPVVNEFVVGDGFSSIVDILKRKGHRVETNDGGRQIHYGDFSDMPREVLRSKSFRLPVQVSGRCSWEKCLFCSIKSTGPEKIRVAPLIEWMIKASKEYGVSRFGFVDRDLNSNLSDFERLCSKFVEEGCELDLWGMLNTWNLTKDVCRKMRITGFTHVLLGIENLSGEMLSKMMKRSTVLDNIKALKWMEEVEISSVAFNIIIDFPGVSKAVIEENIKNFKLIGHLLTERFKPGLIEFHLERDAKAFELRRELGLENVCNYEYDEVCYPSGKRESLKLHGLKYKWSKIPEGWEIVQRLVASRDNKYLKLIRRGEEFMICDGRDGEVEHPLKRSEYEIYRLMCNRPSTVKELMQNVTRDKMLVRKTLDYLFRIGAAVREGEQYFGLALETEGTLPNAGDKMS